MTAPRSPGPRPARTARAAVAVLLSLAAACTGGGTGQDAGPTPDGGGSRDIFVASGRDVTGRGGVRQQLIDDWNARQKTEKGADAYRAHLVELSGSADQQRSQLLGALQSGSAEYDVVNLDVTWVPEFAAARLVRPLDADLLDDDVIASVARTARWKDDVYAVPFNSDVGLLYYRRDYLAKAGLEDTDLRGKVATWSDLDALINDVDRAGLPAPYEAGWTTQLDDYEGRTVNAVEAFASSGSDGVKLTDDEGRYTGSTTRLLGGVKDVRTRTARGLTLAEAYGSDEAKSLADFAAGKTAFLRHWPYAYGALGQTFGASQLGVIPMPGRAVLGGQNLAVTSASPDSSKGPAQDLIRFLAGEESQCRLLRAGFAATRKSAYGDGSGACAKEPAAAASPGSGEGPGGPAPDDKGGREYERLTLLPALEHAAQRPRTPYYGAFTQTLRTALAPLFGEGPGKEDERLAKDLDQALREAMPTAD